MNAPHMDRDDAGFPRGLVILSAFLALGILLSTCFAVFSCYHRVFPWDAWETVDLYKRFLEGRLDIAALWEQHNEHRILVPRLFILADYVLASASGYLLISLSLLLQGMTVWLLARAFARYGAAGRGEAVFFCCLAVALCFWLKQRENFIWSFQVQWLLNGFFASLGAYWAGGIGAEGSSRAVRGRLAGIALCCFIATYSLANGIFLAFIIGVTLWRSGLPRRWLLAWAVFALLLAGSYLAGYHTPAQHSSPVDALDFRVPLYAFAYLGNPAVFAGIPLAPGLLLGALGLGLFGVLSIGFLRRRESGFFERFAFTGTSYVVATAVVTAAGRRDFDILTASASRYLTPVLLFWCLLLGWVLSLSRPRGRLRRWLPRVALLAAVLYLLPMQFLLLQKMKQRHLEYDEAALALMAGVKDTAALRLLYPVDGPLWERGGYLRDHGLSIYRDPWARMLGAPLAAPLEARAPMRAILAEKRFIDMPPREGFFVRGRLDLSSAPGEPDVILFTRDGMVAGFARTAKRSCRGCFSGYVAGRDSAFEMRALDPDDPARSRPIQAR
jgi:hypothetical protein